MTKPSNKDDQGLKVQGRQPRFFGVAVGLGGYIMKILIEAVFPRKCRSCGRFWHLGSSGTAGARQVPRTDPPEDALVDHFQRVAAPFLCPDCLTDFEAVASPLCRCCGAMFASRIGTDHLCGHCLQRGFQFRRARSAGVYGGALLSLIHQLKYRACLALCQPLGTLLQQIFELHWQPDEIDLVLPVPLHRRRFRRRGFNQAHLLTMAWANMPEARSIMNRLAKPREQAQTCVIHN